MIRLPGYGLIGSYSSPERLYARACLGEWRLRLMTLDGERYDDFQPYTNL